MWHLIYIHATSKPDAGLNMLQLEDEANAAPTGKVYSDSGLRILADGFYQVIECEIRGVAQGRQLDLENASIVVIEALDSTEWVIRADGGQDDRIDIHSPLFTSLA